MSYLEQTKDFKGVADVFMRDPDLYGPLLQFIEAVMTRQSALTVAEREVIASYVSHINGCDFCVGVHHATLKSLKTDENVLGQLTDGPRSSAIDDRLKAVLTFAEKLTQDPHEVAPADITQLRSAGWDDQAIEDAINVVSLFAYVNRLVDATGVKGSPDYFAYVGDMLATQGYAPLIKMAARKAS
ncbi:MAG: peroxidase-related enzyme [Parvibaculaceae bacterium]|nr:peroxidase-related enzyme [Parvibaculaceae bacterium]HBM87406.1 peroxidase [Rhodobiaceae bacterium]|tara:strand:+ start:1824 stop:2378 length:555 start_codon:yes stop_codon:yes gene_type:complete